MFYNAKTLCKLCLAAAFAYSTSAAPVLVQDVANSISAIATPTFKNFVYFGDWENNFSPNMLPADQASHVLYSFADIQSNGAVFIGENRRPGMSETATGYIKDLIELKKKHRTMKTLLSIGGWTYTNIKEKDNIRGPVSTVAGRTKFVATAVDLLKNYGFDGIDIDWEYPNDSQEAANFVAVLKELREALDAYAAKSAGGYHFQITVACPASAGQYGTMHLKDMDQYLDAWNLMAYDFTGQWDKVAHHDANLYPDAKNPAKTSLSATGSIKGYLDAGISAHKIILGMPLYGKAFRGVSEFGQEVSPIEGGDSLYKDLPKLGATEYYDPDVVGTYSYDPQTRELITYQGLEETKAKAKYIKESGLGGAMWWLSSGDKNGSDSLIYTAMKEMGKLDDSRNCLSYPESQYKNIANALQDWDQKRVGEAMSEVIKLFQSVWDSGHRRLDRGLN